MSNNKKVRNVFYSSRKSDHRNEFLKRDFSTYEKYGSKTILNNGFKSSDSQRSIYSY